MSFLSPSQYDTAEPSGSHHWLGWVFLISWMVVIALTVMVHKSSADIVHTYALPVIAGSLWMSVYLLFLTPELNAE